ncbi:HAAS signaling domain-containing protein [Neobacillus sp. NPDC097160]|uniref:HAAS signaling domain-containing protein n=1 Tax=Neobacillus sp. NPDC097160 TaxID=3364298 RepID=UPI00380F02CD
MKTLNLIEVYIYEVTKRLPVKSRDDIALELRSTIEDMLPENYSEVDVKDALTKLGNPAVLAASYHDKPIYLIGPNLYDNYILTMKRVIPWAILISIFIHIFENIVFFSGKEAILSVAINTIGILIGNVINVLIQVFFWITIVFAVVERVGISNPDLPHNKKCKKWTPEDLKNAEIIPKKKAISKADVVFSFIWTAIWAIAYFNADHLVGIYRSMDGNGNGLQFVMPIFNQDTLLSYWPIVLIFIVLELALIVYKWNAAQWTMKLVIVNAIIHVLSVIAFIVIASNPHLLNDAIIPHTAELLETTSSTVANSLDWIWRLIVATFVVTTLFEIFDSYRKARIR